MQYIKLIFILSVLFIQACSTVNLEKVADPENKRILILAKSNDRFDIIHDGNHFFPAFRPKKMTTAKPAWRLRDVFFDTIEKSQSESKFQLISVRDHPKHKLDDHSDYKQRAKVLKSLAKQYQADYILLLSGGKFYDQYGNVTLESQYGYYHTVLMGLTKLKTEAMVYIQSYINLYDANDIGNTSSPYKNCDSYNQPRFLKKIPAIPLPNKIKGEIDLSKIPKEEMQRLYETARLGFEDGIVTALQRCRIIPAPDYMLEEQGNDDFDF